MKKKKKDFETKIFEATEVEFMRKVQDTLGHVTAEDEGINTHGL